MRTAALLCLCACAADPERPTTPYIAPLDGQTGVPVDLDLLVETGALDLPDDYPVTDDAIRVVDLVEGGLVAGQVRRLGSTLGFSPRGGWVEGRAYAWTVSQPPSASRQPELALPEWILGDATFTAGGAPAVLDAATDGAGALCLLLSEAVDAPPADLEVALDDAPLGVAWEVRDEWDGAEALPLRAADPGVSLLCAAGLDLDGGESIRATWGAAGPWRHTVDVIDPAAMSDDERRVTP